MAEAPWREEPAARRMAAGDAAWDGDDDGRLVCRAVRQETHDVKTFVFAPPNPKPFRFRPGQFLTFTFQIDGAAVQRCYTISSPPTRPNSVTTTVKRVPGGPVSNFLHDRLKPGDEVTATAPMGSFSCFEHPAPKYLLLSGGSGITPVMAMARTFHDLAEPRDVVFVHNARSSADIIFGQELELMARLDNNFRFVAVCETDPPGAPHREGRLTLPMLEAIAPDLMEREVFVCGPTAYMAAVRAMLTERGFDMAHHHEESFVFEDLPIAPPAAPDMAAGTVKMFRIELARTKRMFECPADTPVLTAARRAGLRLPSACTKGMCGTCKSKLIAGTVDLKHSGGIRPREIEAGLTLLCCAKPTSDLVIDR